MDLLNDSSYVLTWWFFIAAVGAIGTPTTLIVFKNFKDGGYGLTKALSILAVSYTIFLLSTLRLLPFTRVGIFLVLALFFAVNFYIYSKNKSTISASIRKFFPLMLFEEILFLAGLLLWSHVRSFQPDINGLEKFMDYGFVNTILRSEYLPAVDMWFSGESINYYWFGHFITAVLTKLSDIPSGITYNLMLATILGLSISASFSLVFNILASRFKSLKTAILGGLISAVLLNFAGNFHAPYYIYKEGRDSYWYPDATRFIGYNPETEDKTIHEFPIYSYVVSDLHAHLLNLPFVLLYTSLIFAYLKNTKSAVNKAPKSSRSKNPTTQIYSRYFTNFNPMSPKLPKPIFLGKARNYLLVLIGTVLGIMFMTNAWDFANYLLLSGFAFLIVNLKKFKISFETVFQTAAPIIFILIVSVITILPFILNFESIAEGVKVTHTKSPLWQLAILWGFPALLTAFFAVRIKKLEIEISDLFVLAILTTTWCLIFLPEFIYVKDIYVASHYRANTMFKLTYQAFVLSYLASGYIAVRVVNTFNKFYLKFSAALVFLVMFASIMTYPKIAVYSYYGELANKKGLNGEKWLFDQSPDTYAAVNWLRKVKGQPVILEAPGDSYTEFNVISSYTGLPTVSGWFVHEWLWRGSPDAPQKRVDDITQIYTSSDFLATQSLLQKYNVRFVVVGSKEFEKFPSLNEEKFAVLGREVFKTKTIKIYEIN